MQEHNVRDESTNIVNIVLLYLYLLFSCGYYYHEHKIAFTGPMIIAIIMLIKNRYFRAYKRLVIVTCTLIANVIISSLFANDTFETIILSLSSIVSAFIIASSFSKKNFLDIFIKLIYILCIGSDVIFIINLVRPSIFYLFPSLVDSHGISGYYTLLSIVTLKTQWIAARNASIFWEPGVFQTFIILAFAFEMSKYGMHRNRFGIIFLVTIITTLSTTGIICAGIMTIIWLLEINSNKSLKGIRIIVSLVFLITLAVAIFRYIPQGISNKTADKLFDILEGDTTNFSVTSRVDSIVYPLQSFFSSPIIGVGSKGLSSWTGSLGHSLRTCTPLNWFARFGFVFGLIANIGFTQVLDKMYSVKICNVMLLFLLLLCIATEAYTVNAAILVFVFYGFIQNSVLQRNIEEENSANAV